MEQIFCCNQQLIIITMVTLLQKFGSHLIKQFKSANSCTFVLCKIHVFCIGKGKMAVDEVFQLTSTAKLRLLK